MCDFIRVIKCALISCLIVISPVFAGICPEGDVNSDCKVDIGDLLVLADNWLENPGCSGVGCANLTGDPIVNMADYSLVAEYWQSLGYPLVINEYMSDNENTIEDPGQPGAYPDWIEVYNYGSFPVDLAGLYLTDSQADPFQWMIPQGHPEQTTVPAGGYLLFWADENITYGPTHADFKLSKGGGEFIGLYLKGPDQGSVLIDGIATESQDPDQSSGRFPDGADSWNTFFLSSEDPDGKPTPGMPNGGVTLDSFVVINEIMYHPSSENDLDEYIELYNRSSLPINLGGWSFSQGFSYVLPDVTIAPNSFIIIAADVTQFNTTYPGVSVPVVGGWTGTLNNRSETLTLVNDFGMLVDTVEYADQGDWSKRLLGPVDYTHRGWTWSDAHDGGGKTLELKNPDWDNEYGQNWLASLTNNGTPGQVNSTFATTSAPLITKVKQDPFIPGSSDSVTVTAQIFNNNSLLPTVQLAWRIDQSVYSLNTYPTYNPASYTFVGMTDNGSGLYSATIPPQADGAVIEFFVTAVNSDGSRTYPAPCDVDGTDQQVANLLYQVDDSFDPDAAWIPGSQPIYRVIMTEAERARLSDMGDNDDPSDEQWSDAQMNATFISIDGTDSDLKYTVGIRNRGNGSRYNPPMNFHVNFVHDNPWGSTNALNLNSKYTHLQMLGNTLFRLADIPAPNAKLIQLRINGQNLADTDPTRTYGAYVAIEPFSSDYLDKNIPDDDAGNLYRCTYYYNESGVRIDADFTYRGEDPASYYNNYDKKTNEEEDDWTDLYALTFALNNQALSDEEFISAVEQVVNLKQWARFFAVNNLIGNREGGLVTGDGDDFAMYRGGLDQRFILLPHDMDTLLGQSTSSYSSSVSWPIFEYDSVPGLSRLFNHPDFMQLYYQQFNELTSTVLAPENIDPIIDQLLGGQIPDSIINGSTGIKAFLVDRANNILYGPDPQVPSQTFTVSGNSYTASGSFSLLGTINPITTRSIMVDNIPVPNTDWDQKTGQWSFNSGTAGNTTELIIPRQSYWKYLDDGSNQGVITDGTSWYGHPDFDDSGFKPESQAKFGYGNGNEVTTVSYGPDSSNKYITTYFRKTFEVADASQYSLLKLRVLRDDGVAVYLNGNLIARQKLPETFNYLQTAEEPAVGGDDENTFFEENVDPSLLLTGTNVIAVEIHQVSPTSSDIGFDLELEGTIGGVGSLNQEIIPRQSFWKYLDDGSNQGVITDGTSWYGHPDFDDSGFKPESQAKFGYGDGDEVTTVSYGPNSSNKYITTYFRKTFEVADASQYSLLKLRVLRDDGVAVYLNGNLIARQKLPETFNYLQTAEEPAVGGDDENTFFEENVDPSLLLTGTNVIAAEIHQVSPTSSDIGFDLELEGTVPSSDGGGGSLNPGMNRVRIEGFGGPEGTGKQIENGHLDIFNDIGRTTDVSGILKGDPNDIGNIEVVVRDSYLPTVPVLVRVELRDEQNKIKRNVWDMTATLAVDSPQVSLDIDQIQLYNGMGSALVTFTGSGDFNLTVDINGMQTVKALRDLQTEPVNTVTGSMASNETWNGVYHITGSDFDIPDGITLTVEAGSLILVDGVSSGTGGLDINIAGSIQSHGTAEAPVTFTAFSSGNNWGEFDFNGAESSTFQYTNITQGGHSPGIGHTGSGPVLRTSGSTVVFEHSNLTDHVGKIGHNTSGSDLTFDDCLLARSWMGPEIEGTALYLNDTWIVDMHGPDDADGIYIHDQNVGQSCTLSGGVIANLDDDGVDTFGSEVTIEDIIVRDCKDKGISVYDGHTQIRYSLIVNNNSSPEDPTVASIAAKATDSQTTIVDIDHSTISTTKTQGVTDFGIQSHNKFAETSGSIIWNITNTIISATDPIDVQAPYLESDVSVDYSCLTGETWPGTGNLNADPLFTDTTLNNFTLQSGSPCINTGDPLMTDPDGSRTDMGYSPYEDVVENLKDTAVWTLGMSPYRVTADLTVPAGLTLEIDPGVTVLFEPGTKMIVNGTFIAEGTETDEIFFTKTTSSSGEWGGLQFVDTMQDNHISYAVLDQCRSADGMIGLLNSNLLLENSWLGYTGTASLAPLRRIEFQNSSLTVRDCVFSDMCSPGQAPMDNLSEHIWGSSVPEGGQLLIENNTFGTTPGHNDAIDIDSVLPQTAIPQIINNTFLGGGDDALDLETDAFIEGNLFKNYIKDAYNTDPQESNIVSAGRGQTYTMVRNVLVNCEHAVQVKDDAFLTFINNTVYNTSADAIYFGAAPASPGQGVYIDGCIFDAVAGVLPAIIAPSTAEIHRSIVPESLLGLGNGNIDDVPLFTDVSKDDFTLLPDSPGKEAARWGYDMGAMVDGAVTVLSGPAALTYQSTAVFTFGAPGVTDYMYRLDQGTWSLPQTLGTPAILNGLADGQHSLEVIGKNYANQWQSSEDATVWNWIVDNSEVRIIINEISAASPGYDWIELYNDSASAVNLAGMSISDNPADPLKYVFGEEAIIGAGDYLVVYADSDPVPDQISTGFGLNASGEGVYLYDASQNLLDSVKFGNQIASSTIGRIGPNREWRLTSATPGAANITCRTGSIYNLGINEWFTSADNIFGDDFIEIYNPTSLPLDISGLFITDNPINQPIKNPFANLSFIDSFGLLVLTADSSQNPGHVNFRLNSDEEMVALLDTDLTVIDKVLYMPQTTDISQGASPDGSHSYSFFENPTPGKLNTETIVINEVLAHSHAGLPDWIELYNTSSQTIDISGWYLSDDPVDLKKFEIPAGTILLPDHYVVFYEDVDFGAAVLPTGFGLSEGGESLYLCSAEDGELTGYRTEEDFGASDTDISLGRYQQSTGAYNFVAMAQKTIGSANSAPLTGPVVISEILYHPAGGEDASALEYIELVNITGSSVNLFSTVDTQYGPDPEQTQQDIIPWQMTNGIEFSFPANTVLSAGERILLVKDLAAFNAHYSSVPSGVRRFQWTSGSLSNDGEKLQLSMPGDQEYNENRYWICVDRVKYEDSGSWPTEPDTDGMSLERINNSLFGDDPVNWQSSVPTPGL